MCFHSGGISSFRLNFRGCNSNKTEKNHSPFWAIAIPILWHTGLQMILLSSSLFFFFKYLVPKTTLQISNNNIIMSFPSPDCTIQPSVIISLWFVLSVDNRFAWDSFCVWTVTQKGVGLDQSDDTVTSLYQLYYH